jgi:hypothetical protein
VRVCQFRHSPEGPAIVAVGLGRPAVGRPAEGHGRTGTEVTCDR